MEKYARETRPNGVVLGWEIHPEESDQYGTYPEFYTLTADGWNGDRGARVRSDHLGLTHLVAFTCIVGRNEVIDQWRVDLAANSLVGGDFGLDASAAELSDALAVAEGAFMAFVNANTPEDW